MITATRLAVRVLWVVVPLAIGSGAAAAGLLWLGLEGPRDLRAMLYEAIGSRQSMIEAHFNVFLADGALTYVREPCDAADVGPRFFLHVFPWEVGDLPFRTNAFGFENLDFGFVDSFGSLDDGTCSVTVALPKYPIRHVATGQYDNTGQLWAGSLNIARPLAARIVERSDAVLAPGAVVTLGTHLHALDVSTIRLEPFASTCGGAIERVGDSLLVATPHGRLASIGPDGEASYLQARVSMPDLSAATGQCVVDLLVRERRNGHYDLFATHRFFSGGCQRFELSANTLHVVNGGLEVSPTWRTVFTEPCLVVRRVPKSGYLLADGPHHLLLTIENKVLRVNLTTGEASTLTTGHRAPSGLARDRHGNVWLTEHGPRGGDELNLLEPGAHYGWPEVSYGYDYSHKTLKPDETTPGHHDGFVAPTFAWVPAIGISAIVVNDATAFPLWEDDLLIGSLSGSRSQGFALFRLRHRHQGGGGQVRYVERIVLGDRIRDLAHAPDGLAVLTDRARVLLLRPSDRWCGKAPPLPLHNPVVEAEPTIHVYAVHCASAPPTPAGVGAWATGAHAMLASP